MNQVSIQFDTKKARQRRDDGMKRAVDHADTVERGWSDMAYEFFTNVFLKHHKGTFMAEDLWANENDLQLLIERPDFDAGEMRYEIIEPTSELVSHE